MNKSKALSSIDNFLEWFDDNMSQESFLGFDEYGQEVWTSYNDLPEYVAACDSLEYLRNNNE